MSNEKLGKKRFNYSWIIIALSFLLVCVSLGFCSSTNSLFLSPVTQHLGVERSAFSLNNSFRFIATAVVNLFFGVMISKFGPKNLILAGTICLVGAMVLYSVAENVLVFYLGGTLLGVGFSWTGTAMVGYVVNIWCKKNKGTIMGAILASNGIGGAIAMQIVSPIIESGPVGYKRAYFLIAIILVVLFVLMAIFFKNKPKNAEVDTEQTADNSAPKKKSRGDSWVGIGWSDVVKKWWFYLALVSIFLTGMCLQGVTGVSAAHMKDVGIDGAFVATVLSIHSIALACAKFLTGFIYDKCGLRTTVTMCAVLSSIVMIALALITNTTTGMVIAVAYGILSSFALPLETIVLPIYASDLFGEKSYAKILGVVVAANVSGYAVGAPLVNLCFDISGSYNVAFYICAGVMALVVVSLQILISAARKEKNKILNSVGVTENQDLEIDIQQESNDGNN